MNERRQMAEERKKTLEERNRLAEENARHRENIREQKQKASKAALDSLVASRKRGRK